MNDILSIIRAVYSSQSNGRCSHLSNIKECRSCLKHISLLFAYLFLNVINSQKWTQKDGELFMELWVISAAYIVYSFLVPISYIFLALCILVGLPLFFVQKTRIISNKLFFIASIVWSLTVWFMGLGITMDSWGMIGFIIGVLIAGIGVIPLGIVGAFVKLGQPHAATIMIIFCAFIIGARILAFYERKRSKYLSS